MMNPISPKVGCASVAAFVLFVSACSPGEGASAPSGGGGGPVGAAGYKAAAGAPGSGGFPVGTGGRPSAGTGGAPAAGGAPAVTSTGGASTATQPTTVYDPSVTFSWPEGTKSIGSCKAGHYVGTFEGTYVSPATFVGVPVPVSGDLDLTLTQSAKGEFFDIANGKMSGVADLVFPFSSGLVGTLNCTTAKLEGGFMTKGTYNALGTNYFYEGPLIGDYDKLTNAFVNGTWRVGEPTWAPPAPPTTFGGFGTWTVKWVGP